jgi:hypothetical protein
LTLEIGMAYLSGGNCLARNEEFRVDVVEVPLERLALQIVAKLAAA